MTRTIVTQLIDKLLRSSVNGMYQQGITFIDDLADVIADEEDDDDEKKGYDDVGELLPMTDAERKRSFSTEGSLPGVTPAPADGEAKSAAKKSRRVSVHWPEGEVASVLATK